MRIPFEDAEEFEARRALMSRARRGDDHAKAILLARYKVTIYSEVERRSIGPTVSKKASRRSGGTAV